jgi:hypothetical protein
MDLLRACQREGLVRLERDRRGGLRVFQGPALQRPSTLSMAPVEPTGEGRPLETEPGQAAAIREPMETEQAEVEPMPIDTTAELLGRAKPKRQRARPSIGAPRGLKPAGVRKVAARRAPRPKKIQRPEATEESET